MRRATAILAVLLITSATYAQESFHPKTVIDPEEGLPLYKRKYFAPEGYVGPEQKLLSDLAALTRQSALTPGVPVVITYGGGGSINEHNLKFAGYRDAGLKVEIRGGCMSACTLITAYVGKDKLCFATGGFLAFHAARTANHESLPLLTGVMYRQQPPEIRSWIDRTGGHENLPLDGFWTMRDHELWAIGYPKCK